MKEKFKNICVVLVVGYTVYTVISFVAVLLLSATDTNIGKKCKDYLTRIWEKIKYEFKKITDIFSHDDPVVE
jgi:hypothetical protein